MKILGTYTHEFRLFVSSSFIRRSNRSNGYRHHHSEHDGDGKDGQSTDDDVFIEDKVVKPRSNLTRHQSAISTSKADSRRFQQQSSSVFRRHASQCSADDAPLINPMELKKQKSPLTLITRTNPMNRDEAMTYETPQSEQMQPPVCNTHTMKKKRAFHTINTAGCSTANNQQMSKQLLHAIMNSMNHNQEPLSNTPPPMPASPTSVTDDFFENGPLTNPEEAIANMTPSS